MAQANEELRRRALDKVLSEISEAMDEEDTRRLREEIDAGNSPRAENPLGPENLAVDGEQSEAELEGGHAGNLAAEDVDEAEGGDVTSITGEGSEAQAVASGERELDRAAGKAGTDTRPGYMDGTQVPDVSTETRGAGAGQFNADNAGVMVRGDAGKGGEAAPSQPTEYESSFNRDNQGAATGIGRRRRRFRRG